MSSQILLTFFFFFSSCLRLDIMPFVVSVEGFIIAWTNSAKTRDIQTSYRIKSISSTQILPSSPIDEWKGEVVPGQTIQGCTIAPVEGSLTEWVIKIDGVEADIGRFSDAIYKKIIKDAKTQRFQGFRPGTVPPHLDTTYKAFAMDECARETVLEAMQQNNIRPFESSRQELIFTSFSIPPSTTNSKSGKKKNSKRKSNPKNTETSSGLPIAEEQVEVKPVWITYETMKQAIDAGWKPGQSFSFVAKNCRGQKVKDVSELKDAKPLGLNY